MVERWYDVEVVYEGPKPEGHFRGKVPRNVMASEMLKIIEASGVKCRIENKKDHHYEISYSGYLNKKPGRVEGEPGSK